MIAQISLAPQAVYDVAAGQPPALTKSQHESLLRSIEAHGMLVAANDAEALELLHAIKAPGALPPGIRTRWVTSLAELKKRNRFICMTPQLPRGLREAASIDDLRAGWVGKAQVTVLTIAQARSLGVDDEGLLVDSETSLELASAPIAAYCSTLNLLRELAEDGHVQTGASRDEFWDQVVAPIARVSRRVTVLDRYLLGNLAWHHQNLPRSSRWEVENLVWLLDHLDRSGIQGTAVRLIASDSIENKIGDADDAARMIKEVWRPAPRGQISTLEVTVAPWNQRGKRMPHDRHIRFDIGVGIRLPAGWDRFKKARVEDPDGVGWQYLWRPNAFRDLRAAENRVVDDGEATKAQVLDRTAR